MEETVWLTQEQIAYLFGTQRSEELDEKAAVSKMEIVQIKGSRHIFHFGIYGMYKFCTFHSMESLKGWNILLFVPFLCEFLPKIFIYLHVIQKFHANFALKIIDKMDKGEIIIYHASDGTTNLEVRLEEETVWLMQEQIAYLFGTQRPAITKHLNNIYKSGELDECSTCSILEHMGNDKLQRYKTKYYNSTFASYLI